MLESACEVLEAAQQTYTDLLNEAEHSVRKAHEDWLLNRPRRAPTLEPTSVEESADGEDDAAQVEADRRQCVALFEKVKAAEQERQECLDEITASAEARKAEAAADEALAGNDPGPIPAALVRTQVPA